MEYLKGEVNHFPPAAFVEIVCSFQIASFPGPAQLFITCSMEKWEEPGIFSHGEHDIINKWQKKEKAKFHIV